MAVTGADGKVSSTVVSQAIGLKPRRIQQLVEQGILPAERRNRTLRFDLVDTVRAYIDHLNERISNKDKDAVTLEQDKLRAEVDFRQAKAKKAQLDLAVYEGHLHRSRDVKEAVEGLTYSVRSAVLAMPGRLSMDLARMTDRNEVYQALKDECYSVLDELSRHAYDPKFYEERVRANSDEED